MRVPRFFAPGLPTAPGAAFELAGEEAHHGLHVLRLKPGALVEVFDGEGGAGRFEVQRAGKTTLELALKARADDDREARCAITLAFAPPRPKRTLALIEKATELGVARFVPLATARTRAGIPDKAIDKLRRRAIEAAKQCGRNRLPTFSTTVGLDALAASEAELKLLPDTRDARPLREALRGVEGRSALFAVGPEGGFEDGERDVLRAAGFAPVMLGRAVLRVETAALAIVACLRYELG